MELNEIETNQCFLQKEGINQIVTRHKIGTYSDLNFKQVISREPPYHVQVLEYPPRGETLSHLTTLKKTCTSQVMSTLTKYYEYLDSSRF